MDYRSIFNTWCFVFLASMFTPNVIHSMNGSSVVASGVKEVVHFAGEFEQVVDSCIGLDECEANVEVGFPVSNPQLIEIGVKSLIQLSKNTSQEAKRMCLAIAATVTKGIEKNYESNILYEPNVVDVRDIIQKNRDRILQQDLEKMDPELRQIFNSCLDRHDLKIQRFAIRNDCNTCVVVVLISFIFLFMVQQIYL